MLEPDSLILRWGAASWFHHHRETERLLKSAAFQTPENESARRLFRTQAVNDQMDEMQRLQAGLSMTAARSIAWGQSPSGEEVVTGWEDLGRQFALRAVQREAADVTAPGPPS
jgi:hypothetical protein